MARRPDRYAVSSGRRVRGPALTLALCGIALLLASASRPAAAQMLVNGGVVSGSIAVPFEEDSYTFSANAGEGFLLRLVDTSAGTLYPRIEVFDPSMTFVTSASGQDVAAINATAAATGTYTVVVSDGNSTPDETGDYDVHFALAPGANEGGALPNGGKVTDTIDLGDLDSFTFTANAGEGFLLRVADLGATALFPIMRLYDPSGAFVTSGSGFDVGAITTTAAATGTYTVVVSDGNSTPAQTGDYDLYFTLVPGANEDGTLPNGASVSNTIDLGDIDSYIFTANAGEGFLLRVTDFNGTALFPIIRLYDPSGAFVTSGSGALVGSISTTAAATGTYTVVVSDGNSTPSQTGDYVLNFALAPGANEHGALPNGGVVSRTIPVGDIDSFTFTANAGESFLLRIADVNGTTLFPQVNVYDPSGAFVTSGSGFDVGSIATTAGTTGTYTVMAFDGNSTPDEAGDFDLYFVLAPGANEGGTLPNGGVVSDTVDLGDLDSYTFTASAGNNILLRVADVGTTTLFPRILLYDPSGAFVTSGAGFDVGSIITTAGLTGTYTVVVLDGNSTPDETGDYDLHFVLTPGANEGGSLENGVTRFDAIDLGDLDSYTFVGSVGQNAEIIVTDLGPGAIFPLVAAYGPDGTFITSAFGAVTATILLPISVDGIYTVVVLDGNSTPSATGPYSLVLNGAGAVPVPISPLAVVLMALMLAATGTLVVRQQAARGQAARR